VIEASTLINPSTSKPVLPGAGELYVETTAIKVKNSGSKFSSDQVTFKCPYCDRRNKQNIRRTVSRPSGEIASFRCLCSRLVYVRRPVSTQKVVLAG
jgi:hypothetical protein